MNLKTAILGIFSLMSMVIIGFIYFQLVIGFDESQEAHAQDLLSSNATILQSELSDDLIEGSAQSVQRTIMKQMLLPNIADVFVLDESDNIIASSRVNLLGSALQTEFAQIKILSPDLMRNVRESFTGQIVKSDDSQYMSAIFPVITSREMQDFKPADVGLLVINYDLSQSIQDLQASVLNSTLKSGAVVVALLLVVGIALHKVITYRIRNILNVMNRYIGGDRDARIALSGSNELTEITAAFDQVMDSAEQTLTDLRHSQESLNRAQRIAHVGNWDWDIVKGTLAWSDEIYRIFGLQPQEFGATYEAFLEYIHPDDRESVTQAVTKSLEENVPYSIEHRVVRPDGEVRIVHEHGEIERDDSGAPIFMSGTVQDITERKETEGEVGRFGRILENSWNEIYIFNAETYHFVHVNRAALDNLKYTLKEMRDLTAYGIKPEYTHDSFHNAMRPLVEGKQEHLIFETYHERKDGSLYPVEVRVQYLASEEPKLFFAVINDITERKIAEQALIEARDKLEQKVEERTRELSVEKAKAEDYLNIAGTIIVALDKDGAIVLLNKKGRDVLGYGDETLIGKNWFDLVIPQDQLSDVKGAFDNILKGNIDPVENFENHILTRTGVERLVSWNNTYLFDDEKNIIGCLSAGEDITERRFAEEALKESQQQLLKAQEIAGLGNWSWRIADGVEEWSDQHFRILGFEPGEIQPSYQLFLNTIHADDRPRVLEAIDKTLNEDQPYNVEFRIIRPDGKEKFIVAQGEVQRDEEGMPEIMVGTALDITERKTIELQLMQSAKMATLGEMATGVAHELNQPLNVIRLAVNNIQRKSRKNETDPDYLNDKLDKVESQVERASAIIDHMRIFGRRADMTPSLLDPEKIVTSTLGLIGEQLRLAGIDVRVDAQEAYPGFLGHQVQVEQVFLNILGNARDQLRDRDGEKRIDITISEEDGNIQFAVDDTGGGIPSDHLPRIFEPFFTTKEIGAGTGLGLSISYGIIADMGGAIEASNTDKGARFTITLPVYQEGNNAISGHA